MTPYEKARALRWSFYAALPLFFAVFLFVVLTESKSAIIALVAVLLMPWGVFLISKKWPACPTCGQKLLEETQGSSFSGAGHGHGFSVKLDPAKKECGYCGQDLTVKSLPA